MTKLELNRLIAEQVLGMVVCDKWKPVNYKEAGGPMIMRDTSRCPHQMEKCYPAWQVDTAFGKVGGPPPYCDTSRAALVLLKAIQDRSDYIALCKTPDKKWYLQLIDYVQDEYDPELGDAPPIESEYLNTPVPASTPEMAIALGAAGLTGITITEAEIAG